MPTLSAAQRRALAEHDARWLKLPLPGGSDPAPVAAHVRHLVNLMGPGRRSSAAAVARHWAELYDRSVPHNFQLACRQGCAHCCNQTVSIYAPEAFRIAELVRERAATSAAMHAAVEKLNASKADANTVRWMSCPLLSGNLCTVYEARPLNCRAFVAIDLRECISAFVMMGKPAVRMPIPITNMRTYCHMLMMTALSLAGKKAAVYEMNGAVSRVLETPDAEARWLAGEDIFTDLAQAVPMAPEIEGEIQRMAAFIAPTLGLV